MSTFERPMMSIKTVNALSHYTDWTVAHVHAGALGWVGFVTIGSVYYKIPSLIWQRTDAQHQAGRSTFLDCDHRRGSVYRCHVDCRCDAGFDVEFFER